MLVVAALAVAQTSPEFSADMQMKTKGEEAFNGKIYFAGGKIRTDMNTEGQEMRHITDVNAQRAYTIMVGQNMYMEHDLKQPNPMAARGPRTPELRKLDLNNPCAGTEYSCKRVGAESVNGRSTVKWDFSLKQTGKHEMFMWVDQKIPMAIRTLLADGSQIDLLNLKEGRQDPTLFQIPSGYQKLDMGNLMRGMPAGDPDEDQD
ncbi:MAG TPA: DUF4412 domain-containing protein [Clostridia bacterium]|nr:DUF4412 domain-containing protein [Clostridia bacterium]